MTSMALSWISARLSGMWSGVLGGREERPAPRGTGLGVVGLPGHGPGHRLPVGRRHQSRSLIASR